MNRNHSDDHTITYPEDYDRDYYDQLKREYADRENVRIFSKDDYDLDENLTPWLEDNRGRDIADIRRNMHNRPVESDELTDVPDRLMRHTDLHTPEEIAAFEPRMRVADAVSSREWEDPMPESDFDRDERWIHLRKMDDEDVHDDGEAFFASLQEKPLKRKVYDTPEQEWDALMASLDRMQAENLDYDDFTETEWGEADSRPDPSDLDKWHQAAKERGGNAVQSESYFLPPLTKRDPFEEGKRALSVTEASDGSLEFPSPPPQQRVLESVHLGEWRGIARVFEISDAREIEVRPCREFPLQSGTVVHDNDSLEWTSVIAGSSSETVSHVVLTSAKHKDSLVPGRAVAKNGSYALKPNRSEPGEQMRGPAGLTVSTGCLRSMTGDAATVADFEVCMVSEDLRRNRNLVRRDRFILCRSPDGDSGDPPGKRNARFRYVVLMSEYKGSVAQELRPDLGRQSSTIESGESTSCSSILEGRWEGRGALLHPEFPPANFLEVDTRLSFVHAENISDTDVTWVENESREEPGHESNRRTRLLRKKKTSKRVAAARNHDRRRLAQCAFLSQEKVGDDADTVTFAWKVTHSPDGLSCLFSPRIGRFVDDHAGIFFGNRFLLTLPFSNACPGVQNTVCLTELKRPCRQRINLGMNEWGDLVGVVFITESLCDASICDDVASYV